MVHEWVLGWEDCCADDFGGSDAWINWSGRICYHLCFATQMCYFAKRLFAPYSWDSYHSCYTGGRSHSFREWYRGVAAMGSSGNVAFSVYSFFLPSVRIYCIQHFEKFLLLLYFFILLFLCLSADNSSDVMTLFFNSLCSVSLSSADCEHLSSSEWRLG